MAVADFLSRNGGGGGLQAGELTGLRRAGGVCGEGGVGRRNALRGEWVRRRAGKRLASVSDVRSDTGITPVSDSSDCRRELKSVPPATRRETSSSEQMPTERAREHPRRREREPAKKSRVYVLLTVYFVLLNTLFVARHP